MLFAETNEQPVPSESSLSCVLAGDSESAICWLVSCVFSWGNPMKAKVNWSKILPDSYISLVGSDLIPLRIKIIGLPMYLTSAGDITRFWKLLPSIRAGPVI